MSPPPLAALLGGIRARILLVGFASAFAGLIVGRFVVHRVAEFVITEYAGRIVAHIMARDEGERCRASAASWSYVIAGVSVTYAYDPGTHAPLNPAAPALDLTAMEHLAPTEDGEVGVHFRVPAEPGFLVSHLPGGGPCSLLQTRWVPIADSGWLFVALPCLVGAASVFWSFVLAIRPLVQGIAALRRAAANVGAPEGYASVAAGGAADDLGQLARELDRAHHRIRDDAAALREERTALERHLEDVAHDLRTPLASLQLALEHALALNHDPTLADPLHRALGDTLYAGALTENLRLASKLERGWDVAEATTVDLSALVDRVALRMKFVATERGLSLEVALPDKPVVVRCHPIAVEQAVANVVDNAVTLGGAGGHVAIVLQSGQDGTFVLTVADDGPGVRSSELPRLGERTFRSDEARQRAPHGSGLGLAITAAVCERSGWTLTFEPEQPTGLRVSIRGARL